MRHLPWFDGSAALVAAILVLVARSQLSAFYGVSECWLVVLGGVNMLYAAGALTFAAQARRSAEWLATLVFANAIWSVVCAILCVYLSLHGQVLAAVHMTLEGAFVLFLARLERRYRGDILTSSKRA